MIANIPKTSECKNLEFSWEIKRGEGVVAGCCGGDHGEGSAGERVMGRDCGVCFFIFGHDSQLTVS